MRRLAPAALLLAITPAIALAQGITLHPKLKEGQVARYDIKGAFAIDRQWPRRGDGSALADTRSLEQDIRLRLTVVGVTADGSAAIRGAFEKISERIKTPGAGEEERTDWTPETPAPPADAKPGLSVTLSQLGHCILEFQVAPDGTVSKLDGLDPAVEAAKGWIGPHAPMVLGLFTPESAAATMYSIYAIDPAGADRVVGASWSLTRQTPILESTKAIARTKYKLKQMSDGIAEITGDSIYEIAAPPGNSDTSDPTLTIADQSGKTVAKWDTAAGRLVSRTEESKITWMATLRVDRPITARPTMSSKTTITFVDGDAPPAGQKRPPAEPKPVEPKPAPPK